MYCKICGYILQEGEETKICPICGNVFNEETLEKEGDGLDSVFYPKKTDEDETTVLKAEPEEEGTTVLVGNAMQGGNTAAPDNVRQGQMQPNMNRQQPMAPNGVPLYPDAQNNRNEKKKDKKAAKKTTEKAAKKSSKKTPKKKMSTGKKVVIFIIIFIIVAVLAAAGILFGLKYSSYTNAGKELDKGNVEEAINLYERAKPYKDSEEMVNGGAYYEYAQMLLEEKNYTEAAEYFAKAAEAGYSDSDEMVKSTYLNYANQLYNQGDYEEAITYYELAENDGDMADKINECKYLIACKLFDEEDYESALDAFEELGSYEDSEEKITQCYYYQGLAKMEAEEYEEAIDLFTKAGTEDSVSMANECQYLLAVQYEDAGDYENAIAAYEQVDSSYKDCASKIQNAYIEWGDLLADQKDYKGAIEKYESVGSSKTEDKITAAKAAYVEKNFKADDETTMEYICDLKYAGYDGAEDDYRELTGWTVDSFVNYEDNNIDDKEDAVSADKNIYVHTTYSNDDNGSLNITGYILYSDGTKSNEVSFSKVTSDKVSWLQITASSAPTGKTILYLHDTDSGNLIEKYTFTIE